MTTSFEHMAIREAAAEKRFTDALMRFSGCTENQALKVMAMYLKKRLAVMDRVNGEIRVKHGSFLDKGTINAAIAICENSNEKES